MYDALGIPELKPEARARLERAGDSVSGFSSISRGLQFEEEAQCPSCGVQVLANCNFCHNCGAKVLIDGAFAGRVLSD